MSQNGRHNCILAPAAEKCGISNWFGKIQYSNNLRTLYPQFVSNRLSPIFKAEWTLPRMSLIVEDDQPFKDILASMGTANFDPMVAVALNEFARSAYS